MFSLLLCFIITWNRCLIFLVPIRGPIRTIRGYARVRDTRKYGRRSAEMEGAVKTRAVGRRRKKGKVGKAGANERSVGWLVGRSVGSQVGRISRLNITEYSFVSSSKLGYEGAAAVSCSLRLLLASSHPEFQYANFSPFPVSPQCVHCPFLLASRDSLEYLIELHLKNILETRESRRSSDQTVSFIPKRDINISIEHLSFQTLETDASKMSVRVKCYIVLCLY